MANKRTVALSKEQYEIIINTMQTGSSKFKPNPRIACCLILEANLGMRIGDIINLKMSDIIQDGDRYRLNIVEQKSSKKRHFTVPPFVYEFLKIYCKKMEIYDGCRLFRMTVRNVQIYLKKVVDYLGYKNISTHSFRKFFATEIYKNNKYNIVLVKNILQHSHLRTTERYIGLGTQEMENAIMSHNALISIF